jgi:hypothetical protein
LGRGAACGDLQELSAADFDLLLVVFSDAEFDQLLAFDVNLEDGASDGGEVVPKAPEVPVSRSGDLWLLGPHRLFCGDAIADLDPEQVGRLRLFCRWPFRT